MKVLIAPDKFKGSLSAMEVCDAIQRGIHSVDDSVHISKLPMADGGEGSLDILVDAMGLELVEAEVLDPLFRPIRAVFGVKGASAYIEMAKASGLQLLEEKERNPMKTSSIGTGQLVLEAIKKGVREVYLFVGGSATNDGGIGMAHGLGFRFLDASGKELQPSGASLIDIHTVIRPELPEFELIIVTDVENTLVGEQGATRVYGAQKGGDAKQLDQLERGMVHFSKILNGTAAQQIEQIPGSGAAGGIGAVGMGLLHGTIQKGITTFLTITAFETECKGADLVITGEGKIDHQTLSGKVVHGVVSKANELSLPVLITCGVNELSPDERKILNVIDILQLKEEQISVQESIQQAGRLLEDRLRIFWKQFGS